MNSQAMTPPRNEPASPSTIVPGTVIGSLPGTRRRAIAPTIRPSKTRAMTYQRTTGLAELLEQPQPRGVVFGVVEHAGVVQLLEQAEVVRGILGRLAGMVVRGRRRLRLRAHARL